MIEELRKNIDTEIEMLREISSYSNLLAGRSPSEQKILQNSIASLQASMKLVNKSIPNILSMVSLAKKLPAKSDSTGLENVNFQGDKGSVDVVLRAEDKALFFKQLSVNEAMFKKIRKEIVKQQEPMQMYQAPRGYVKLSNRFFMHSAENLVNKGRFKSLSLDLRKANLDILLGSYVAMMLFSAAIAFLAGLAIMIFLLFFDISFSFPFVSATQASYGSSLLKLFWIPIILPVGTFIFLYVYPSTERSSIEKRIDQELPFAVIHMSAVSGSGIEPSNIFKIIVLSNEYPALRKEIRKVLNQINLYGYDLVTALNNVAKNTPSAKLSELYSGLATTIRSGGDLSAFFEKRAESLLVSYRLEREKFTKTAETFMDIYITVAIAAPMILLLILVMLSVSDFNLGLSPLQLTFLLIAAVSLINVVFLTMLNMKQPAY